MTSLASLPKPSCILCGDPGEVLHEDLPDLMSGVPGHWAFRRCGRPACGLVWLDPSPTETDLPKAYASYYTHVPSAPQAAGRPRMRDLAYRAAQQGAALVMELAGVGRQRKRGDTLFLGGRPRGRLLEVGCGDGSRLLRMRAQGWEAEGQEVDPQAAALRLPGVKVHLGSLQDLGLPAGRYDAVAMAHVLEHVIDPVALLAECRRLLAPGGILSALTPNADSAGHRRFGRHWYGLDPPRHLHLFNPATVRTAALKAGFAGDRLRIFTTHGEVRNFSWGSVSNRNAEGAPSLRGPIAPDRVALGLAWTEAVRRGQGEELVLMATVE